MPAIVVEKSGNAKTGPISVTYGAPACPTTCMHRGVSCYAESGLVRMHMNKVGSDKDAFEEISRDERLKIEQLTGKRKLRVHVGGEVIGPSDAYALTQTMRRHKAKYGQPAWGYTHKWVECSRALWEAGTNIGDYFLASCDTPEEAEAAQGLDWAVALTVPPHPKWGRYQYHGLTVLPCPAQKHPRKVTCATCSLCGNLARLKATKEVIGFQLE